MKTLPTHGFHTVVLCLVLLWGFLPATGRAAETGPGKIFRIGYFEVGPFWTSDLTFKAFQAGLAERGWLQRLEFVQDARYSPGWTIEQQELDRLAGEIMARSDLDLILSMGTRATRALLAANNHRTAILGMDLSDPVKASLVKDPNDSGASNFTTMLDEDSWEGMFNFFHEFTGFKRLGLLVLDHPDGAVFTHLEVARKVARDRGFDLVLYSGLEDEADIEACRKGIDRLMAQGIDAFFIPDYLCFDLDHNPENGWFRRFNRNRIATFASEGSRMIKQGALMGKSNCQIEAAGCLYADRAIRILQGNPPGSLPMRHTASPSIALNLETAHTIGIRFPFHMLSVFDEIFLETER